LADVQLNERTLSSLGERVKEPGEPILSSPRFTKKQYSLVRWCNLLKDCQYLFHLGRGNHHRPNLVGTIRIADDHLERPARFGNRIRREELTLHVLDDALPITGKIGREYWTPWRHVGCLITFPFHAPPLKEPGTLHRVWHPH